jgi:hypothetical protein
MTLTVRSATVSGATTKGSALTHAELDENFNHLSQSSNHTFTPSGSGAVSESVQTSLRRMVWAEQFGAVGDGSTDDTTAIQAAIDSLTSGGCVLFQGNKTHKITASLKFKVSNTWLASLGGLVVIRQATTSAQGIENATGSRLYNCGLQNVLFRSASGVTCGKGIYLLDMTDTVLINSGVDATAHASDGFVEGIVIESTSGKGAYYNRLYSPIVVTKDGASSIGIKLTGVNLNGANSNAVYGGKVTADEGIGIYILGDQNVISGVAVEGTDIATGIEVANDGNSSGGNYIAGNRFEGIVTNGILFDASTIGSTCIGNQFASGITNKVVDNGENFVLEASHRYGSKLLLTKGQFEGKVSRTANEGIFIGRVASTGVSAFETRLTADTTARWQVTPARMYWGDGSGGGAVGFFRSASAVLQLEAGTLDLNSLAVIGSGSSGPKLLSSTTVPAGAQSAPIGSFYANSSTSGNYIKLAGSGTGGWGGISATLSILTTAVGNVGTGEDDLQSYAMPADILLTNGRGVVIDVYGTVANNANTKQIKLYFGTVAIVDQALTVSQVGKFHIRAEVIRTGTDAQDYSYHLTQTGTTAIHDVGVGTLTQDDGAAITIKTTGTVTDGGGGVNNNDIVVEYTRVTMVY